MATTPAPAPAPLTLADTTRTWWPLAASWLLMGLELPLVSAIVARLPDAKVQLAAFGGVVMPTALLIEAPVIMLLSASTALCRDQASYAVVRGFMRRLGFGFSALHAAVAFSPLYDLVVVPLLGVPEAVREPARQALQCMVPWTFAIAYRRTQQGVLIRFGDPRAVSWGTAVRLLANAVVLSTALAWPALPGAVFGALSVTAGVIAEACFAGLRVRPVRRLALPALDPAATPLDPRGFMRFYLPLSLTPVLMFLGMPVATAAMTRMPEPLESLAAWPALNGLLLTLRSTGFAFNEVVVALLDREQAQVVLRRFASRLALVLSACMGVAVATPLGDLWFAHVSGLPPDLVSLAGMALWLALALPAMAPFQSLFTGTLVHARRTRAITESVVLQLAAMVGVFAAGVAWQGAPGLWAAVVAWNIGGGVQAGWLWYRSRSLRGA